MNAPSHLRSLLPSLFVLVTACAGPEKEAPASDGPASPSLPTIAEHTEGLQPIPGFLPMWWDAEGGRVLFELEPGGPELLHWTSLPEGLGSNDVGLDRGQVGRRRLLRVLRSGRRVLLIEPNLRWRSSSAELAEQEAAQESFARSVLHGFEVLAEGEGRALVDGTDFLERDLHLVTSSLGRTGQGAYRLDPERGAILADGLRGFPDNSMVDVLQTFGSEEPGNEVVATSPDGRAASLVVRHNFVRLPPAGYRPRAFHPRSGYTPQRWNDLGAALDEPLGRAWIARHRLEKRDPRMASSAALDPIVYYIDRGAPEPVRTALLEGARYWEPVFAAAGFPGGFRAELLPEGADVHDARYNVVQWVHRSTRGWSYGNSITDPRTGEILKGHVTLGALRVRQDVLLAEGLLSPYVDGAEDPRPVATALARIRQLSAHEIGHTLGLAHNFAASTRGRASVMDYPAPLARLDDGGEIDLSDAYREGCGEWDELAIRYGYSDFTHLDPAAPGDRTEREGLEAVLAQALREDQPFLTDRDARGADRAHPLANLWDNGADPLEHLARVYELRAHALARLGPAALRPGRDLAELEEVLVPVYLHHRYQLEAAVRSLGGLEYSYVRRGDGAAPPRAVPAARQRRALALALESLRPEFLALPPAMLAALPPRPPGSAPSRERFEEGALLLDPVGPARASVELSLEQLLNPERCRRLVDQARRDPEQVSLEELIAALVDQAWGEAPGSPTGADLVAEVRHGIARHLMRIAADEGVPLRVREPALRTIAGLVEREPAGSLLFATLQRYLDDPAEVLAGVRPARVPPGSPIGCGAGPEVR